MNMAIVKEIKKSIKAQKYVNDSIAYILVLRIKVVRRSVLSLLV